MEDKQKEEKKNVVDNQTVQIQMQLENEKTEEVVLEKAKEEPKQPKEKEQKQLQSKDEKTQQFNKRLKTNVIFHKIVDMFD